jgi:hypothetical protein
MLVKKSSKAGNEPADPPIHTIGKNLDLDIFDDILFVLAVSAGMFCSGFFLLGINAFFGAQMYHLKIKYTHHLFNCFACLRQACYISIVMP